MEPDCAICGTTGFCYSCQRKELRARDELRMREEHRQALIREKALEKLTTEERAVLGVAH